MDEKKIIEELADIEAQLSPEWLTCDGELSAGEVKRRASKLYARQAKLEKMLGRKPSVHELFPGLFKS